MLRSTMVALALFAGAALPAAARRSTIAPKPPWKPRWPAFWLRNYAAYASELDKLTTAINAADANLAP